MPDRTVLVVSGLEYSGKSFLLRDLLNQPELARAKFFPVDPIRIALYGSRPDGHITKTEHIFKNDWARYEMLRALITGTEVVGTEAVMLTKQGHQRPMVEMVTKANVYIQAIEREYCERDNLPLSLVPSTVRLKVVLCYVSFQQMISRMNRDHTERLNSASVIFTWKDFNSYPQFEFPDETTYEPLYLDTSDESSEANQTRLKEVIAFINNELDPKEVNNSRITAAFESFNSARLRVLAAKEHS